MFFKKIVNLLQSSIMVGTLYYTGMIGAVLVVLYHYFIEDKQIVNRTLVIAVICILLVATSIILAKTSNKKEFSFLETPITGDITAIFSLVVILALLVLVLFF